MASRRLIVEIDEALYDKFILTVTERGGGWRPDDREPLKAIRSAVEAALRMFLQDLEAGGEIVKEVGHVKGKGSHS